MASSSIPYYAPRRGAQSDWDVTNREFQIMKMFFKSKGLSIFSKYEKEYLTFNQRYKKAGKSNHQIQSKQNKQDEIIAKAQKKREMLDREVVSFEFTSRYPTPKFNDVVSALELHPSGSVSNFAMQGMADALPPVEKQSPPPPMRRVSSESDLLEDIDEFGNPVEQSVNAPMEG